MQKLSKQIAKIFSAKKKRRKKLAKFSVEEKFKILLKLQEISSSILRSRGIEKTPWMPSSVFQIKK